MVVLDSDINPLPLSAAPPRRADRWASPPRRQRDGSRALDISKRFEFLAHRDWHRHRHRHADGYHPLALDNDFAVALSRVAAVVAPAPALRGIDIHGDDVDGVRLLGREDYHRRRWWGELNDGRGRGRRGGEGGEPAAAAAAPRSPRWEAEVVPGRWWSPCGGSWWSHWRRARGKGASSRSRDIRAHKRVGKRRSLWKRSASDGAYSGERRGLTRGWLI